MTSPPAPNPKSEALDLLRQLLKIAQENQTLLKTLVDRSASPPASSQQPGTNQAGYADFQAAQIIMTTNDKGEPAYKIKGGIYLKHGVRVWPEVLPALEIDASQLRPGPNPFTRAVRALLNAEGQPRKIIGLAPQQPSSGNGSRPQKPPQHDDPPF